MKPTIDLTRHQFVRHIGNVMTNPNTTGLPQIETLHELLSYNPETGEFYWKKGRKGGGTKAGAKAGRVNKTSGYMRISINNVRVLAHRVSWAMYYGEWPKEIIDHKNMIKHDNRISNLRLADKSKNAHNSGKTKANTSGFKNVFWNSQRKKWMSLTKIEGRVHYIGLFDKPEDAHKAYEKFANDNIGEFARAL